MHDNDEEDPSVLLRLKAPAFPEKLKLSHWHQKPAWQAAIAILEDNFEVKFSNIERNDVPLRSQRLRSQSRAIIHFLSICDCYNRNTKRTISQLTLCINALDRGIQHNLLTKEVHALLIELKAETEHFKRFVFVHVDSVKKILAESDLSLD